MKDVPEQGEFFGLIFRSFQKPFLLSANDIVRINGRLGLVLRVTESAAVVIMNRRVREFVTRFDKRVRFQPAPILIRISPNSEIEVLKSKTRKKPKPTERKTA